jgi:hypothetical protein
MSNNKQSSVEWLIEQYKKCFGPVIPLIMNNENEKAKAMHKEEIISAVGSCGYIGGATEEEAEQYYNETFGGNK